MATTKIELDHIARIEGHGDIVLRINDGVVSECKFKVTEPARLFESMVRGRPYDEAPYIASRVCGICSSSHTVTDILAVEDAFGVEVSARTRALRELLLYGSFLQNHATHLFVFAAPDFLGHKSVFPLADTNRELFDAALNLKALGNELCTCIGGRSIHPITAVVGGFTNEITTDEYLELAEKVHAQIEFTTSCVDLFDDFGAIDFETAGDGLAMVHDSNDLLQEEPYPVVGSRKLRFIRGNSLTDGAYDFNVDTYDSEIEEYPVDHSAAFLARAKRSGNTYFTSALARLNASWAGLSEPARFAAAKAGLRPPAFNPFANNIAQAVELVDVCVRCSDILRTLSDPTFGGTSAPVDYQIKAGRGIGVTEAPRGILIHDLSIDASGNIESANIITPTSQNIANIEADMRTLAEMLVAHNYHIDAIQLEIEKLARAYDPCLSCSVH